MPNALPTLTRASEDELIVAVRCGNDAAYGVLFDRHEHAARSATRALVRNRADVDDIVSDAFTQVFEVMKRGGGPHLAFRPYLLTTIRNTIYDRVRRGHGSATETDLPDMEAPSPEFDSEDIGLAMAAFQTLPERWRLVLWHTEVEGESAATIGPLLGLAPNAVAALAYRAREGLREAFLKQHVSSGPPDICRFATDHLARYVRGTLSKRDRTKVDTHLIECDRCERILAELQNVGETLRGAAIPFVLGVPAAAYCSKVSTAAGSLGSQPMLQWVGKAFRRARRSAVAQVTGCILLATGIAAGTVRALNQGNNGSPDTRTSTGIRSVGLLAEPVEPPSPPSTGATHPRATTVPIDLGLTDPTIAVASTAVTSDPAPSDLTVISRTTTTSPTFPTRATTTTARSATSTTSAITTTSATSATSTTEATTTSSAPSTVPPFVDTTPARSTTVVPSTTMSIANHADLVGRVAVVNHDHRSITLTVTVRNEGPLQITTPMVRFTVPAGVNTMLELGGAWRCTDVAPFVCTAESLAATFAELRVRLVRTQPTAGGLVTIDVLDASSSTTDPIPENNRLQVTLPLD